MNVKRYFTIWTGTRFHRAYKRMEGDRAFCGLRLRAGWVWTQTDGVVRGKCKRCYR
jgi:hypothetical protein